MEKEKEKGREKGLGKCVEMITGKYRYATKIYNYMCMCTYVYVYIYVYGESDRERERGREVTGHM